MASIILDYDRYNVQAQRALENILASGCFKLRTVEKRYEEVNFSTKENDAVFLRSVSEQVLAKDWLNKAEDEAWKNL
jgi:hypothetical protein